MRRRTDPAIVRYALYLYFNSRSLRLAAKSLAEIKKHSNEAMWKWVHHYRVMCMDERRLVRTILVDETYPKIDYYWL